MSYEGKKQDRDNLVHAEAINLTVGYLLLARELARRDIEHARVVTGLSQGSLETLAKTTVDALRKHLISVQGTVVFVPRLPLSYWNNLSAALREQSIPGDMLAGYAAALSARLDDDQEGVGHGG